MPGTFIPLARNFFHAAAISPPNYVRSIFGEPASWFSPHSEIGRVAAAGPRAALNEALRVAVPALPFRSPVLSVPGTRLLFRPCTVWHEPAPKGVRVRPNEAWLFVNGICTDRTVARVNARYLAELSGQPQLILYDATCGLVPDLIECALGKGWGSLTAAGRLVLHSLIHTLVDPGIERVVLIAHSRGTIIVAAVLHALALAFGQESASTPAGRSAEAAAGARLHHDWKHRTSAYRRSTRTRSMRQALGQHGVRQSGIVRPSDLDESHIRKLQVYAIANCATDMRYVIPVRGRRPAAPYIESIGNQNDLVARLGVLASRRGPGKVCIDGGAYERKDAWGHLLNAHYLSQIEADTVNGRSALVPIAGTTAASRLPGLLRRGAKATTSRSSLRNPR